MRLWLLKSVCMTLSCRREVDLIIDQHICSFAASPPVHRRLEEQARRLVGMVRGPVGRRIVKWAIAIVMFGLVGRMGLALLSWLQNMDHSIAEKYQGSRLATQEIRVVERLWVPFKSNISTLMLN